MSDEGPKPVLGGIADERARGYVHASMDAMIAALPLEFKHGLQRDQILNLAVLVDLAISSRETAELLRWMKAAHQRAEVARTGFTGDELQFATGEKKETPNAE